MSWDNSFVSVLACYFISIVSWHSGNELVGGAVGDWGGSEGEGEGSGNVASSSLDFFSLACERCILWHHYFSCDMCRYIVKVELSRKTGWLSMFMHNIPHSLYTKQEGGKMEDKWQLKFIYIFFILSPCAGHVLDAGIPGGSPATEWSSELQCVPDLGEWNQRQKSHHHTAGHHQESHCQQVLDYTPASLGGQLSFTQAFV